MIAGYQKFRRFTRASLVLLIGVVFLSGCYMPLRFDAEIEISRAGYYNFIFDGYLVKVPFYDELRKGGMNSTEEGEKIAIYKSDLQNDPAMKEVSYLRQGIYKVHWVREGDLTRDKFVTFIRRNENMLSIRYVKDDFTIQLAGKGLAQNQKQQLVDMGLDSVGEIRIITNGRVVAHNASSERDWPDKGPGYKMYTWPVPNIFAPSPQFVMSLR